MAEGGDVSGQEETTLNMRAVVIGGTGAVGKCLVGELINSKNFSKIVVLGRRSTTVPKTYNIDQSAAESEGRLVQVTVDFETLDKESVGEHFQEKDVFFTTLGTTRAHAGSAAAFVHIDHGYTMKCAEIAKDCGISHMSLLTSQGSNANSMFLYMQTKGKIEEDSKKLNFDYLSIFRPGFLNRGVEKRWVETIAAWFVKGICVSDVAKSMRIEAENVVKNRSKEENKEPEVKLYTNKEINDMCKE